MWIIINVINFSEASGFGERCGDGGEQRLHCVSAPAALNSAGPSWLAQHLTHPLHPDVHSCAGRIHLQATPPTEGGVKEDLIKENL